MALFFLICLSSCATTKVYLVRHAEKAGSGPADGLKAPEGVNRANALKDYFKGKALHGVYSTNYPRTIQTAQPVAAVKGLAVLGYNNGDSLLADILQKKNRRYVVVGHSNTIPQMIRAAGLDPSYSGNIPDNEFDNLYIITVKRKNSSLIKSIERKKYGAATP
ncbi:MAG: histidine phosphatase family protein [Ferruginibacter sp.]